MFEYLSSRFEEAHSIVEIEVSVSDRLRSKDLQDLITAVVDWSEEVSLGLETNLLSQTLWQSKVDENEGFPL